jgi:hypothetical protein
MSLTTSASLRKSPIGIGIDPQHGERCARVSQQLDMKTEKNCQHNLTFGRKVEQPLKAGGMLNMYTTFLGATDIKSEKKQHLTRHSIPTKIAEMG